MRRYGFAAAAVGVLVALVLFAWACADEEETLPGVSETEVITPPAETTAASTPTSIYNFATVTPFPTLHAEVSVPAALIESISDRILRELSLVAGVETAEDVKIIASEEVTWADNCMELVDPGPCRCDQPDGSDINCPVLQTPLLNPGYRLTVRVAGDEDGQGYVDYFYHLRQYEDGRAFLLRAGITEGLDKAVEEARQIIWSKGHPVEDFQVLRVEEVIWPDRCATSGACPPPEGPNPGYRITVIASGAEYVFAADRLGDAGSITDIPFLGQPTGTLAPMCPDSDGDTLCDSWEAGEVGE